MTKNYNYTDYTPTTVVNLHHGDAYDVYIGRAGRGHDGYFGNPVRRGIRCSICGDVHEAAAATIPCFIEYFQSRLASDPTYRARVLGLQGKRLGCFCAPARCHGHVIAAWTDMQALEQPIRDLVVGWVQLDSDPSTKAT